LVDSEERITGFFAVFPSLNCQNYSKIEGARETYKYIDKIRWKSPMKIDESKHQKLEIELTKIHNEITSLSKNNYDEINERVMIDYSKNSEGRQKEQVYNEVFKNLLKVKKELDYYSLPSLDSGILKYDQEKERS